MIILIILYNSRFFGKEKILNKLTLSNVPEESQKYDRPAIERKVFTLSKRHRTRDRATER